MNTEIVLIPYKSIGNLDFGMHRNEVRKIMENYDVSPGSLYADNSLDRFCNREIDCFYDKNDIFYGITIGGYFKVVFEGNIIFPISENKFANMFHDSIIDYDGENMTWVKSIGVTAYNYEGQVSSLTIGTKEFYKEIDD